MKVDQHVAAEDDVPRTRFESEGGFRSQVKKFKGDPSLYLIRNDVMRALPAEVLPQIDFRNLAYGALGVDSFLGFPEGLEADIGGPYMDLPVVQVRKVFSQQQGNGIRFLSCGTAGAPDIQGFSVMFFPFIKFWDDNLLKGLKLGFAPEKVGFLNSKGIKQLQNFPLLTLPQIFQVRG